MVFTYSGQAPPVRNATTTHAGLMVATDKAKVDQLATGTAWAALPYAANWSDFAGGNAAGAYKKDALGWVCIQGLAKKGVALGLPDTIGTLPVGFRPATSHNFVAIASGGTLTQISVATTGVVAIQAGGSATWTSLDGIRFDPTT